MANGRPGIPTSTTGYNWIYYIVYVLIAVLVAYGAIFVMLRTELIPRGAWLYEHTTWIPGLGVDSWPRRPH